MKIDVTVCINEQCRQEKNPCCAEIGVENNTTLQPGVERCHVTIILNVEVVTSSNTQVCHSLVPSVNRNMQRRRTVADLEIDVTAVANETFADSVVSPTCSDFQRDARRQTAGAVKTEVVVEQVPLWVIQ